MDKAVRVCSVMHQRHDGFSKQLVESLEQRFFADARGKSLGAGRRGTTTSGPSGGGAGGGAGDPTAVKGEDGEESEKRRRGMLRLLVEFTVRGADG